LIEIGGQPPFERERDPARFVEDKRPMVARR
jgi:hypothetical protein